MPLPIPTAEPEGLAGQGPPLLLHPGVAAGDFDPRVRPAPQTEQDLDRRPFHQVHHRFIEASYGGCESPLDEMTGAFHDGTPQGAAVLSRRSRELTEPAGPPGEVLRFGAGPLLPVDAGHTTARNRCDDPAATHKKQSPLTSRCDSDSRDDMVSFVSGFGLENFPHLPDESTGLWDKFDVKFVSFWVLIRADGTEERAAGTLPEHLVTEATHR